MTDLTDTLPLDLPPATTSRSPGTPTLPRRRSSRRPRAGRAGRVREYCDTQVAPVVNDYWERAEFPTPLVAGYRELGVAGGALRGFGCPGLSPLAEGLVAAELARGDGSIATFNAVHSGLAMTAIGRSAPTSRSSAGCRRWRRSTGSAPSRSLSPNTDPTWSGWAPWPGGSPTAAGR